AVGGARLRVPRPVRQPRPHRPGLIPPPERRELVPYIVDFESVSTDGLGSSPVAPALAGLRANEARYYRNKYDHVFTVEPADDAKETVDFVSRVLKEERDITISSP